MFLELPSPRRGQHSPWRRPGVGMWLWVMSQILVLLWGRCWLNSDSWSTETAFPWSKEESSRNALPCSLPHVMWRQENQGSPLLPLPRIQMTTHSEVPRDISGTGSSEGPEHAGLSHWSGCTPLPKPGIAKFPSLPWALRWPRSCWSRLQHKSSRQFIYNLRESKSIILSSWPSLHIPCSNHRAAGTRLALWMQDFSLWSLSNEADPRGSPTANWYCRIGLLGLHLLAHCRAWHLQVWLHFDSEDNCWNSPQN